MHNYTHPLEALKQHLHAHVKSAGDRGVSYADLVRESRKQGFTAEDGRNAIFKLSHPNYTAADGCIRFSVEQNGVIVFVRKEGEA